MVLILADALEIPLNDRNGMLESAGFQRFYPEEQSSEITGPTKRVLEQMMSQHEPYPLVVMDGHYDVLTFNSGAAAVMARIVKDPSRLAGGRLNGLEMIVDPALCRDFVENWEQSVREVVARIRRQVLASPNDQRLRLLLDDLIERFELDPEWLQPDFSTDVEPFFIVRFRFGEVTLSFSTCLTRFSSPQTTMVEQLVIESFFPVDDSTAEACHALAREGR